MHQEMRDAYKLKALKAAAAMGRRGFDARVVDGAAEAADMVMALIPEGASVAWGGSMTLSRDLGLIKTMRAKGAWRLIDRDLAQGPEAVERALHDAFTADYYLSSANAISQDGQIVNVDGRSNRVAAIAYGPKKVVIVAGANKICPDLDGALERARQQAAPPNAARLDMKTPCRADAVCHDCLSDDCICCNTLITRKSREPGRIIVILVAQSLGY